MSPVILNYVSGPRHEAKLREAIERHCRLPVVGSIPRREEFRIEERHLGLHSSRNPRRPLASSSGSGAGSNPVSTCIRFWRSRGLPTFLKRLIP